MKFCLLLLAMVAYASAHLCLLTPKQRGSMTDLNTPGANDCFLISNPPCGGRNKTSIAETFSLNAANPVIFQKNLDHFNKNKPGMFAISLWQDKQIMLKNISDDASPSGSIYETDVMLGREAQPGPGIIQVVYVTNNPNAPPSFYQCSDVMVK